MTFLLRSIEKDPGCASQILLDGAFISAASLLEPRRKAELEIYPCRSQCCATKANSFVFSWPLKLHIVHSKPSSFTLSLSSGDKSFSTSEELLAPTANTSLRRGVTYCTVYLARGTCSLTVSLSTDEGICRRIFLKPELHVYEPAQEMSIPKDPSISLIKSSVNSEESSMRSGRAGWICQDFSDCSASSGKGHRISFDDRNPDRSGLTGAYCWNGLRIGQTVRVSKLKFWYTKDFISGFQATYIVNGIQKVGPRHRCDAGKRVHCSRIFELYEGENVSCVQLFRPSSDPANPVRHLSVVTDRGRCFSVGSKTPLVQSAPATLLRHPNTAVVGFRGSLERGLITFGFVLELDEIVMKGLEESYKCYVCGVLCSYFTDTKLFLAHVDDCVLSLVASKQVFLRPNTTV